MDYRSMAERALERRTSLFEKRKNIAADTSKGKDERRGALSVIDSQMDDLAAEARDYVEEAERQDEIRNIHGRVPALSNASRARGDVEGDEWRGLLPSNDEYRALTESGDPSEGGYTVPENVSSRYVDLLRNQAVFLKGIPADNVIRFNDKKLTLPVLSDTTMPTLVAENALISEGDDEFAALEFDAKKYADLRSASNEILADSAVNLRAMLADNMTKNLAATYDADAFSGDGTSTPILGILGQGNAVDVASSGPTHDDLADAIGRIWGAGATPSVIWAAPDAAVALLKEREGTNGAYLNGTDNAAALAQNLPILPSRSVPAGTVVIADGTRIFAGIRQDVRIAVSEHARFAYDQVQFRLTMRAAGLYVVEADSTQVLNTPAS